MATMFDPNAPMPDFQAQQESLRRQKMIADVLRKRAEAEPPQGQMVSGHFVAPSWSQHLNTLASSLGAHYTDKKVGDQEREYNEGVNRATTGWQSQLPQARAARPELAGPRDESGSPELDAQPAQMPDRATILQQTLSGMRIPGNKDAALLWNKGMADELTREDAQTDKREAREAQMRQARELEVARLNERIDAALAASEDRKLSIEQRREAAKLAADTRLEVAKLTAAVAQAKVDKPAALKNLPSAQAKAWTENGKSIKFIDKALEAANGHPDAFGLKNLLGNAIRSRTDPKGVDARALVSNIGSLKIHDRSGAAVTAAETPRLRPFIPNVETDNHDTIVKKMKLFQAEYRLMQQEILDLAETQGYKSPLKEEAAPELPAGGGSAAPIGGGETVVSPEIQGQRDVERRRIVQAEFDNEQDPTVKAALGRELARMGAAPTQPKGETKEINGKSYVKINGQWFEQ